MISPDKRIFVAGANGMVGRSVVRELSARGFDNLLTPGSNELDLIDQRQVESFFEAESPVIVILAAAKVGGISANVSQPADFLYRNLMIEANVIHAAYRSGVEKLVLIASSCAYPKDAAQPVREEALLTGPLEPTNGPYALAKIAGIKLCEHYHRQYESNFLSLMPANLYGPDDNFDPESSHVVPALMQKFAEARDRDADSVEIWGSGCPRREFLHADDLANAIVFTLERIEADDIYGNGISHLNVGTGTDISIIELAEILGKIAGFRGEIRCDESKPDGIMRKVLDVSRMHAFGWRHRIDLRDGLKQVYDWYSSSNRYSRREAIGV